MLVALPLHGSGVAQGAGCVGCVAPPALTCVLLQPPRDEIPAAGAPWGGGVALGEGDADDDDALGHGGGRAGQRPGVDQPDILAAQGARFGCGPAHAVGWCRVKRGFWLAGG